MAVVAPFRALRYNSGLNPRLGDILTPPYDVINQQEQDAFYSSHPNNIIRVELNKSCTTDGLEENCYTRAADFFSAWREDETLKRDDAPRFYICRTGYKDVDGRDKVRTGFFCRLKVEDFDQGVILPHEKTFTGHKEDRFKLTEATGANISPVFALYPDDENEVQKTLAEAKSAEPLCSFTDYAGLSQSLHAVEDKGALKKVVELMKDKRIFIADGHHRYETAINYRNYMREKMPDAPSDASFNYVLVYLCSMSDPGLTVFPCHRVLPKLGGFSAQDFLLHAQRYFDWREIPAEGDSEKAREKLARALAQAGEKAQSFGLIASRSDSYYVLSLKSGSVEGDAWRELARPLKNLDVVVLTEVVLDRILGLDNLARDQVHTVEYFSRMDEVIDQVRGQGAQAGFLLNPTKVGQVREVAKAGLVMPRKSTFFYPKVLTGLAINPIEPGERADGV